MYKIIPIALMAMLLAGCGAHSNMAMFGGGEGGGAFAHHMETGGEKAFVFDPNANAWAVYNESGRRVRTGKASGGADFCHDLGRPCRTVAGTFRVQRKRGPDCKSSKFPVGKGGARMPHCMFFHRGYAIHASGDVSSTNGSHGCIRVLPEAAQWLDEEFMNVGTKVIVRPYNT